MTFAKIPGSAASGASVLTVGIKGAIRGKQRKLPDGRIARPDIVILDDPQTDTDAVSPRQVEKLEHIIDSAIEGLAGPAEELAMLMTCTVIQEGDLADKYLDHNVKPHWGGMRFKMLEQMPERMDLWEEYKERRKACISARSEDRELLTAGRQVLSSETRDLQRNFAIAGFAIRKHVQYVARADFKCSIPRHKEYNDLVKRFIYNWSLRENCDVCRRHSLKELLRLIEIHRVVDGDVGILKISNGRIQIIEGDRIRNPNTLNYINNGEYEWLHGVKVGRNNSAFKYAVHKRNPGGYFEMEREVPAENLILCGYFHRADQIRGVSPIVSAINRFKDANEAIEYALAKAKVSQKIGLLTKRDNTADYTEEDAADDEQVRKAVKEYFDTGVLHLNFGLDEDARLFESETPSNEFQAFMQTVIQEALIALDIPLNFLKPDLTNFYGSRGALDDYIDSCADKQAGLINALHEITDWRLRMAVLDGELPEPPDGMSVDDLLWHCEWVGSRIPIHRLIDDCKGYIGAAQAGFISPQKVAGIFGMDYDENLDELAEAIAIAKEKDLPVPFAQVNNYGI